MDFCIYLAEADICVDATQPPRFFVVTRESLRDWDNERLGAWLRDKFADIEDLEGDYHDHATTPAGS